MAEWRRRLGVLVKYADDLVAESKAGLEVRKIAALRTQEWARPAARLAMRAPSAGDLAVPAR